MYIGMVGQSQLSASNGHVSDLVAQMDKQVIHKTTDGGRELLFPFLETFSLILHCLQPKQGGIYVAVHGLLQTLRGSYGRLASSSCLKIRLIQSLLLAVRQV